jgi:predicted amidohydrolase
MAKIAMVQMWVDGGRPEVNVERALAQIKVAADAGANVAVLP